MRTLHVVSLPHTTLTEKDSNCAYSMKVLKFVKMMRMQGCRVVLYGPDEIECEPDEHVVITTENDRRRWGYGGNGYDTTTPFIWDAMQPYWFEANTKAIDAMRERVQPRDYLCLVTSTQAPIADAISGPRWNNPLVVEWAVGYEGVDFRSWAAYESYAWMHHVYGMRKVINGREFDQVIPNFFDASQFYAERKPKKDYLLYIGRVILRKGPHIAGAIAQRLGMKLIVAGPGGHQIAKDHIAGVDDVHIYGDVEYVGAVGYAQRAELMANAAAVLVPTLYIEPFGGVAVEAMLSGAPVVASDWGSFTELIGPQAGGLFRTLKQGVAEVERVQSFDRAKIRKYAERRWSLEAVGPKFMRWFDQLDTLWGEGWYA